jgi:hypothetical protein
MTIREMTNRMELASVAFDAALTTLRRRSRLRPRHQGFNRWPTPDLRMAGADDFEHAFRLVCGSIEAPAVLDRYLVIGRAVHDQERRGYLADPIFGIPLILEKPSVGQGQRSALREQPQLRSEGSIEQNPHDRPLRRQCHRRAGAEAFAEDCDF